MLDFRRRTRRAVVPPGMPVERRLFSLLVGLAIVVMLIGSAGNPENWSWFAPLGVPEVQPQRILEPAGNLVVALADENDADGHPATSPDRAASEPNADQRQRFPGVRTDYLATVRDDTVFRPAESLAWFHLFSVLQPTPQDELAHASEGPVAYLQLNEQPNEYRGRLITISGTVRAAKLVAAPKNGFGIKDYYQLWLQIDRATDELVVLYCLELPADFPLGENLDEPCAATGFFYKRWAYASQGGITTAPLVMAKTLTWQPRPPAPPIVEHPWEQRLLTAAIVAAVLAVIALLYVIRKGRPTLNEATLANDVDDVKVSATLASLDQQLDDSTGPS